MNADAQPQALRSALFQLGIRAPGGAWKTVSLEPLPFVVGRSPNASCVIDAPGVWDRHLRFELDPDEGLIVLAEPGAIVLHESRAIERRRLRNGDQLQAGGVVLQVLVSPPGRRSLGFWEVVLWSVLAAVAVAQVAAALQLGADG